MALQRRHKYVLAALTIYWPALFVATHIPVPEFARKSGLSDKSMHFLAYLVLVSLTWLAISPYAKVHWGKVKCWLVLVVVVWYGAIDEWIQGRVGRNADVHDFVADLLGAVFGLVVLSVFSFWPALLVTSASVIFAMTNFSLVSLIGGSAIINTAFYFVAYLFLTLVWIQYLDRNEFLSERFGKGLRWFGAAIGGPVLLLGAVKLCSVFMDRVIWWTDFLTAVSAIVCAVAVSYFVTRMLWREESSG